MVARSFGRRLHFFVSGGSVRDNLFSRRWTYIWFNFNSTFNLVFIFILQSFVTRYVWLVLVSFLWNVIILFVATRAFPVAGIFYMYLSRVAIIVWGIICYLILDPWKLVIIVCLRLADIRFHFNEAVYIKVIIFSVKVFTILNLKLYMLVSATTDLLVQSIYDFIVNFGDSDMYFILVFMSDNWVLGKYVKFLTFSFCLVLSWYSHMYDNGIYGNDITLLIIGFIYFRCVE